MGAADGEKDGDRISKRFYVVYRRRVMSAQMLKVSIRSKNGDPSQKRCVVNGQMTKASNK